MKDFNFLSIQENLNKAGSVVVAFPKEATVDTIAASLALYLALVEAGKRVALVSPIKPTVGLANLVAIDKIKQEMGGQDLVISFDYVQDSIEKVSYNIENNKFNLVVQAKEGFPPLDSQSVAYSQAGVRGEMIFILGAGALDNLGEIYQKNRKFFEESVTVNIDNQTSNSQYGKVNFVDKEMGAISEIVLALIKASNLPFAKDAAHNLFLGIKQGTDNFTKATVTPETFEAAALCLRQGVKIEEERKEVEKEKPQVPPDWLEPKIFQSSRKI